MNTTQTAALLVLISAVLMTGCDVITGEKDKSDRAELQSQNAALTDEVETLKDQNRQLTQMLEEAEVRLDEKARALEAALEDLHAINENLQTRLSETKSQLVKVGEVVSQIQTDFKTNTVSLEKQIQSLSDLLNQAVESKQYKLDPAAEETAENSDDHSDQK